MAHTGNFNLTRQGAAGILRTKVTSPSPNPDPDPKQVWHNGTETRIVLIVDVWNVEMDEQARRESIQSSQERTQLVAAYAKNRAQFGDNWF